MSQKKRQSVKLITQAHAARKLTFNCVDRRIDAGNKNKHFWEQKKIQLEGFTLIFISDVVNFQCQKKSLTSNFLHNLNPISGKNGDFDMNFYVKILFREAAIFPIFFWIKRPTRSPAMTPKLQVSYPPLNFKL